MRLNLVIILLLLVTLSQARRVKFLSHADSEETPAKSEENGQDGNGEEGHGNGEEGQGDNGEGDSGQGEEGQGESGNGEEGNSNGEESHGEEGHSEEGGCSNGGATGGATGATGNSTGSATGGATSGGEGGQETKQETCKGVIFDAGSSGTRVFVYTWPCRLFNYANPEVEITQKAPSSKVTPGISTFGSNISGIKGYLQPLIDWAGQHVEENIRSRTPILLGATAGMRILEWSEQYDVMEEVRNILRESGYLFETSDWARIISGKDEGAYLWLSVNYLKGLFSTNNLDENQQLRESYTTIDLGGASTQLADDITEADQYSLSWDDAYGTDYHTLDESIYNITLYSHSWLYYGQDQARILTSSFIKNLHKRSQSFENPCFLKGYSTKQPDGSTLKGTGNANDCRDLIDLYLHGFNSTCDQCAIQDSYIPTVKSDSRVYAGGAVVPAAKLLSNPLSFTWADFSTYDDFCVQDFDSSKSDRYYATQCFLGLYTQELLSNGYKIPSDTVIETGDIHEIEPSWTLAAMFDQIDDNSSCNDSPHCNLRRHLKSWKKDSMHPSMKEHKPEKPLSHMMP